ncbi:MAG: hypothetical protein CMQ43_02450 [Gammaproteobacteria bacterium]|nr:hypothetical protein [Gammaproteobacteria bacterium]|tara:strand:- start:12380 stop:13384 length:1005 start_codon:yes stop_codon:yes gene_type:complete
MLYLTTVTPVYHGADTLRRLAEELRIVRDQLERESAPVQLAQAIFVDDGSTDGSDQVLRELRSEYPWIETITLSRNYGQHPATMAGILHASGDWVATLDEDLQHHPAHLLPMLQEAAMASRDIVYAMPDAPVHGSLFRDGASALYKWLIGRVSGNRNVQFFNSFRMMRGSIARAASAVAGHQTYFDLALSWFTSSVGVLRLPLKDHRYAEGRRSGYRLRSLLSHGRRMLQSSDLKMVRLGAVIGFVAMVVALLALVYTIVVRLVFPTLVEASGWASVMVAVLFLGGMNAFLAGLVLEHMTILLMKSHGKPTFFEVDRDQDSVLREWFERRGGQR